MNEIRMFGDRYGPAAAGTGSARLAEKLRAFDSGRRLVEAAGNGAFDSGFFSIASVREEVDGLGGWERWLPDGAFWYASSALGVLYVAAPDGCMWLVNTQVGSIMQTAFPLDEAVALVAKPSTSDDLLMRPLFLAWIGAHHVLAPDCLLASSPPVIESGAWTPESLVPTPSAEFLASTAALFEPVGPTPISIMEPGT